jgi:hypothetical protein
MHRFFIIFHSTAIPDINTLKRALEGGPQDLAILRPGCFMFKSALPAEQIGERCLTAVTGGKVTVCNFHGDWFSNLKDAQLVSWMQTEA